MATYSVENDIVGGGGLGGLGGFGGGGFGLIIILLLFFAIFSGGGLFGNRHDGHYDGGHKSCDVVSNCQIDKDVWVTGLENKQAIIDNQNNLYERGQAEKLYDAKLKINQLETERYIAAGNTAIMQELCKKADAPRVYARADVQCLQPIPGCGDRRDFC